MRTRLLAGIIAAALALAACGGGNDGVGPETAAPADLLGFSATSVGGQTVEVDSLAGSDLVIWFWAPW